MKNRHKRFTFVLFVLLMTALASFFVLKAFRSNLVFFYSPTQIFRGEVPKNINFRIGGLVTHGSLRHDPKSLGITFEITDTKETIKVIYQGILPDLFKEGKGVVAEGMLDQNGIFHANNVLAKHDENYMPPEASSAINRNNQSNSNQQK